MASKRTARPEVPRIDPDSSAPQLLRVIEKKLGFPVQASCRAECLAQLARAERLALVAAFAAASSAAASIHLERIKNKKGGRA